MTILLTPFMSCSAKLPIYAFFVSAFFPGKGGLIMAGLYLLGLVVGIIIALVYRKTLFKGEAVPFVMELPNYRMPGAKNVVHFNLVEDSSQSMLAMAAGVLVPLFKPLGLGDWRVCTSLISGFMAKESVVSTLEILYGGGITAAISPVAAASLLVFSLLYTPCVAAIASIRRELGSKWAVGVVLWQCLIAWIAAFIVHIIGILI